MNKKRTTDNKNIYIIDDALSDRARFKIKNILDNSTRFTIGDQTSTSVTEASSYSNFTCVLDEEKNKVLGIIDTIYAKLKWLPHNKDKITARIIARFMGHIFHLTHDNLNICQATDDLEKLEHLTVVCFTNYFWNTTDGGDLLFADSTGDLDLAISNKPGRIVIFDSTIPFKFSPTIHNKNDPQYIYIASLSRPYSNNE